MIVQSDICDDGKGGNDIYFTFQEFGDYSDDGQVLIGTGSIFKSTVIDIPRDCVQSQTTRHHVVDLVDECLSANVTLTDTFCSYPEKRRRRIMIGNVLDWGVRLD